MSSSSHRQTYLKTYLLKTVQRSRRMIFAAAAGARHRFLCLRARIGKSISKLIYSKLCRELGKWYSLQSPGLGIGFYVFELASANLSQNLSTQNCAEVPRLREWNLLCRWNHFVMKSVYDGWSPAPQGCNASFVQREVACVSKTEGLQVRCKASISSDLSDFIHPWWIYSASADLIGFSSRGAFFLYFVKKISFVDINYTVC